MIADLDVYDATPRALCNAVNAVVISTHYRQAAENKFPAAHEDSLAVLGNCAELGEWDVRRCVPMECINSNTWFAEISFGTSSGRPIRYKYVLYKASNLTAPLRESSIPRERGVPAEGVTKWRDIWDE